MEDQKNTNINNNKQTNTKAVSSPAKLIHLERGGTIVNTSIGPIQFGIPPETIKDCMTLSIPSKKRRNTGMNERINVENERKRIF